MNLTLLSPRKSLNKAYLKVKPSRSEIELFKKNLIGLLDGLDETETEEHNKNDLGDFLKNTFYHPRFYINTKDRTDLVIHNGPDSKSFPAVLIEAKKPSNKAEMIRPDNLNAKAFHELILYYFRERITNHNLEIKHLIATNVYEWYVFDANFFEKTFAQNKTLVKQFTDFEEGRLAGKTTDFFYKEIAEPLMTSIIADLCFTWFDFREYEKPLRNDDKKDDSKLIALYKLLSPEHLLKLPFANDSNSLDKAFYTELLHIMGLSETKDGSKKLIGRKPEVQRDPGSLIENAMIQIESRDMISRVSKPSRFGATSQDRLFNVSLELVITWMNRVLFLKLLEAQLIKYHKGDSSYSFLSTDKIHGYDALDSLFFRVLAKKIQERDPGVATLFEKVPYLNSSLFDPTDLERETIFISNLQDDSLIPIYSGTVLKNNTGKRLTGSLSGIDYLFAFLEAYDFSGEGAEEIQEENKTLINASVLGLIFEKINGYKDGSFFTPGFITMYMCRETIRRAVVQKFNDLKGWSCTNLDEVYDKCGDRKEANDIVNQLKICDPAVGSGHFLVSALNEIIAIKSEMKILSDSDGRRLKEYHVEVANDELIITDEDGELFEYNPRNPESQRIQETLFHEKQTIIENCLFGVDLNPNSVKICRLRLWIELLKSSYYMAESSYTELETLPNIDINIKCGNSLISRYALDADIKQALKKSKWSIESYRLAVETYHKATSKEQKREMERLIASIKSDFETEVAANDKRLIQLRKLNGDLFTLTNQISLFERSKKELAEWNKKVSDLAGKIKKLETELEEIKNNIIYENAFEWRFEFPEVINDEGDFIGFDVVIGNPPYGVKIQESQYFKDKFDLITNFDSYQLFVLESYELLKQGGFTALIIPNSWMNRKSGKEFRSKIKSYKFNIGVNFREQVFEDANIDTAIIIFSKEELKTNQILVSDIISPKNILSFKDYNIIGQDIWILLDKFNCGLNLNIFGIIQKIEDESTRLGESYFIIGGYKPYQVGYGKSIKGDFPQTIEDVSNRVYHSTAKIDETFYPDIKGENIHKYYITPNKQWVKWGDWLMSPKKREYFINPKIIVREVSGKTITAGVDYLGYFTNDTTHMILENDKVSLRFILAIINSKLIGWYFRTVYGEENDLFPKIKINELKELPIKYSSSEFRSVLIQLVDQILIIKGSNPAADVSSFEAEIDQLVYSLYGLTEEEIKIIEQS